jgi:hypothetical protein
MTFKAAAGGARPAKNGAGAMRALLIKEIKLSLHPTIPIFLLLSAMLIIPNYPYYVVFFYTGLAIFFTCLSGRENNDVFYTAMLPVRKIEVVRARIMFAVLAEAAQLLCAVPFAVLRARLPLPQNSVGMDANAAFFGLSLVMLGIFNFVFFTRYYKNILKVGYAFVWASTAMAVYIAAAETCDHVVPFMRDRLDTPDPAYLSEKLAVLAAGAAIFALLTLAAAAESERSFERLDL